MLLKKKTEDDVLYEFLDTFEAHYSLLHPEIQTNKDRVINLQEWIEYYNNISCNIDNDDYFETMITNAYGLDGKLLAAKKKAWAVQN